MLDTRPRSTTQWSDHLTDRGGKNNKKKPRGNVRERGLPLEAIEPRRLYRQIADQLRQLIDRRRISRGQPPPDRARAGRHAGRVAPDRARSADRARGRGPPAHPRRLRHLRHAYEQPASRFTQTAPIEGPFEVLRARAFVESAVAEEAARRANARRHRAPGRRSGGGRRAAPEHRALGHARPQFPSRRRRDARQRRAAAYGRRAVRPAHQPLFSCSLPGTSRTMRLAGGACGACRHRDAIAAHDPAAARAAMREHLERSHRRFSRDFGEDAVRTAGSRGVASAAGSWPGRKNTQSVQDTQRAAQGGAPLAIDPGPSPLRQSGEIRNGKDRT